MTKHSRISRSTDSASGGNAQRRATEIRMKPMALPLSICRAKEQSTGYKGLSIVDANGFHVANMVFQLDDSEVRNARLIVDAVNSNFRQDSLAFAASTGVGEISGNEGVDKSGAGESR